MRYPSDLKYLETVQVPANGSQSEVYRLPDCSKALSMIGSDATFEPMYLITEVEDQIFLCYISVVFPRENFPDMSDIE
jgi:hypothetical protein